MSFTSMDTSFGEALKASGWLVVTPFVEFKKGRWRIVFDTSNWMEVGTDTNPRVFDVPLPEKHLITWTLNLIDHLLSTDDALGHSGRASI